jgi:hypothetical protein
MSLKGDIVGEPHLDRYPYLQLEADVEALKVQVDEGDMWRGAGGNSTGRAGTWEMVDLTRNRVHRRAVGRRPTGRSVALAGATAARFVGVPMLCVLLW